MKLEELLLNICNQERTMENIVIDIHECLDKNPEFFVREAFRVLEAGGNVHIVTGVPWSDELEEELLGYGNGLKYWTHFASIIEILVERDVPRYL